MVVQSVQRVAVESRLRLSGVLREEIQEEVLRLSALAPSRLKEAAQLQTGLTRGGHKQTRGELTATNKLRVAGFASDLRSFPSFPAEL